MAIKYSKIISVGYLYFFIVGVWGPIALRNLACNVTIKFALWLDHILDQWVFVLDDRVFVTSWCSI